MLGGYLSAAAGGPVSRGSCSIWSMNALPLPVLQLRLTLFILCVEHKNKEENLSRYYLLSVRTNCVLILSSILIPCLL